MNKTSLIITISLLLMVLGGCKDSQNEEQSPTPENQEQTTNQTKEEPQEFPDPTERGQTLPPSALTPATNPDQRANQILKGSSIANRNPFGPIIPPVSTPQELGKISPLPGMNGSGSLSNIEQTKVNTGGSSVTGKTTKPISKPILPTEPSVSRLALNKTPTVQQSIPSNIPIPPPPQMTPEILPGGIPTQPSGKLQTSRDIPKVKPNFDFIPPPKPEPDQARAVSVSGIIDINGEKHAIVKAPGETHSRYVKTGDLLANGQVLVKRIDVNQDNPQVVLEQLGQEVPLAAEAADTPKN